MTVMKEVPIFLGRLKNSMLCKTLNLNTFIFLFSNEPVYEISNNVVCATSKASVQPVHACSLIRAFASCLIFYDC